MESRNAKFLENDLISGSDKFRNISSERDHYEVEPSGIGNRLLIIPTPQVKMGVRQPVIEVPQVVESDHIDQVVSEEQHDDIEQAGEEPVGQFPQQDDQAALRRSTRVKKTTIPSDYVVYLRESD